LYLNLHFIERGVECSTRSLPKTYEVYRDEYSNEALADGKIEHIFMKEIMILHILHKIWKFSYY